MNSDLRTDKVREQPQTQRVVVMHPRMFDVDKVVIQHIAIYNRLTGIGLERVIPGERAGQMWLAEKQYDRRRQHPPQDQSQFSSCHVCTLGKSASVSLQQGQVQPRRSQNGGLPVALPTTRNLFGLADKHPRIAAATARRCRPRQANVVARQSVFADGRAG